MTRLLPAALLATILLAGAVAPAKSAEPKPVALTADEAAQRQAEYLTKGPPDLSVVYIARFDIGGKTVDVTSLSSAILAKAPYKNEGAISGARFAKDRKSIEFLSRDPATGTGTSLVLPLDGKTKEISFPLLSDGALRPAKITLLSVDHQP